MAFNDKLADRIRESLVDVPDVIEKYMFGGVCFMVDNKMCVGVVKDEMMCRISPDIYEDALSKNGCREMVFAGKPMKGYVYIDDEGLRTKADFEFWNQLCLDYNSVAKAAKKKKK